MVGTALVFFVFVNVALGIKVWVDKLHKDAGKVIDHSISFAINSLVVSLFGVLSFGWSAGGWIILAGGYWWLIFDLIFAKINWGVWVFYGSTSKLDIWLKKLGKFHLVPKILMMVLGIYLIIKL